MGTFILGLLLTYGPQTLYSLNKLFQQGASLFYSASFGALQSALRGLLAAGHVTVAETTQNGRHKKVHTITDAGVAALHAWLRGPLEGELELAVLTRLFHLGLVEDAEERATILAGMIAATTQQLAGLEEVEARVREQQVPPEAALVFRYQTATLDYGINAHRAALAWLRGFAASADGTMDA